MQPSEADRKMLRTWLNHPQTERMVGTTTTSAGWIEQLLNALETAEEALRAHMQERNTWARQIADVRDDLATAKEQFDKERGARIDAEQAFDSFRIDLEEMLDDCDQRRETPNRPNLIKVSAVRELLGKDYWND